jgi:hypothetical protein
VLNEPPYYLIGIMGRLRSGQQFTLTLGEITEYALRDKEVNE